jgi:hypothetical protein
MYSEVMNMLKNALVISVASVAVGAVVVLFGAASSNADSGGCPNEAAANGAAHANGKSAHGDAKQSERGCVAQAPEPTPEPTPTPPPALPPADLQVMGVFVNVPSTATAGVPFAFFSAGATVRNNGTASTVMADTAFTATIPADCVATPGVSVVVQDKWFPVNMNVFVSKSWSVTCAATGPHVFSMGVSAAIDSTQAFSDPNPANNNGTGGGSTQVN